MAVKVNTKAIRRSSGRDVRKVLRNGELPKKIADTPDRADGNGVIWQEPGGATWLFYVVRYGETWSDSVIKYKYSLDNANNWTDSEMLTFEKGMMVRSQPIPVDEERRFSGADLS